MPLDPQVKVSEDSLASSAIENELPTYRAISALAVFSVLFGVLAVLSYAHWFFLAFAILAIVLGFLADRKIQRYADILTGRGLAQVGIALGLVFGLTSLTIGTVQSILLERRARSFAQTLVPLFTRGTIDDVLFMNQPPRVRKNTTPEKLAKELKENARDAQMSEMQTGPYRYLKTCVDAPNSTIDFVRIESSGDDGRELYAAALFKVNSTKPENPAEKDSHALIVVKAIPNDVGAYEWWMSDLKYPYKPDSYVPPSKPVDDGHGHGEGDGHAH